MGNSVMLNGVEYTVTTIQSLFSRTQEVMSKLSANNVDARLYSMSSV